MYKSNRAKAIDFMENVISHIEDRELDYDKILATMMTDIGLSATISKEILDAYIIAGKLILKNHNLILPLDKIAEIKQKKQEQNDKEFKEAGLQ